jgi:hypothetical protein
MLGDWRERLEIYVDFRRFARMIGDLHEYRGNEACAWRLAIDWVPHKYGHVYSQYIGDFWESSIIKLRQQGTFDGRVKQWIILFMVHKRRSQWDWNCAYLVTIDMKIIRKRFYRWEFFSFRILHACIHTCMHACMHTVASPAWLVIKRSFWKCFKSFNVGLVWQQGNDAYVQNNYISLYLNVVNI